MGIRSGTVALALTVAIVIAGCGANGEDGGEPATSAAATAASPGVTAVSTAMPDGCAPGNAAPSASDSDVAVNADGDETADRFRAEAAPGHGVILQLVLDERSVFRLEMEQGGERIATIGGYDVDGDGRDELFAQTGNGAYSTWIDVFVFDEATCARVRLAAPGAVVPQFAVGASLAGGAGLACKNGGFVAAMTSRTSDEPLRYEGKRTSYAIRGTVLQAVGEEQFSIDGPGGAEAVLDCGNLALP